MANPDNFFPTRPECRFRFSSLTLQALGLGLGGSGLSRPTTATTAICWARKDQLLLGGDAFCISFWGWDLFFLGGGKLSLGVMKGTENGCESMKTANYLE